MQRLHRREIVAGRDYVPHRLRNPRRRKYTRAAYVEVHMEAGTVIFRPISVDIYIVVMVGIMCAMRMAMMHVIGVAMIMRMHHGRRERAGRHRKGKTERRR